MTVARRVLKPRKITARGAETRARIIDAAAKLVHERGVGRTSLDEVMEASATSKSQLYHYFTDKNALVAAVIQAQADRVMSFQDSCLDQVDTMAGLRLWRDAIVAVNRETGGIGGCPIGSLASEMVDRSEAARKLLVESFRIWERRLTACLEAMRVRGELGADTNPTNLAATMLGALQGGLLLAQVTRTTRSLELVLDMALEHVGRRSGIAASENRPAKGQRAARKVEAK